MWLKSIWRAWLGVGLMSVLVACGGADVAVKYASPTFIEGYEKVTVADTQAEIYVGEFIVDSGDVISSEGPDETGTLVIQLSPEASMKLADATRKGIGKPFAILYEGTVITAPVLKRSIEGGKLEIQLPTEPAP